jgi:hypothetical protein
MSLLSHRNLIRRVDLWMPIKLRSLMTGPEIGVYVGMSLYLQAADVHRTLGNGGSDISGANLAKNPKLRSPIGRHTSRPSGRSAFIHALRQLQRDSISEASSALSEAFLPPHIGS